MNIKILDSWLRDYLKTDATPQKIAEVMSLTSVSIEKIEKFKNDFAYDIEITTNRTDLMSVVGLAREAATVLNRFGVKAEFIPPAYPKPEKIKNPVDLKIEKPDPKLVHRICAVVMDVTLKQSPQFIQDRLEANGIRSLNNVIDITNYVMRTTGHPTHVFDYERIKDHLIKIRESKKGEKIITLDNKTHELPGDDIVAEDGSGKIIDLLAIMGLENSVITEDTKKIIYFIDNNDPAHIRNSSMSMAIRTEAAQLLEKGIDPELAMDALLHGIELFKKFADGKVVSNLIDIYQKPYQKKSIKISLEKIQHLIGVPVKTDQCIDILNGLGLTTKVTSNNLSIDIPSYRANDITIEEDIVEEIARVFGYHNIPSKLAPLSINQVARFTDEFYWEQRLKNSLKYWGFTEVYTYSMVSEKMLAIETDEAVRIKNALTEDLTYMRRSILPSLLAFTAENPTREEVKIFELSNVYLKKKKELPDEILIFAGIVKKSQVSFFEVKGLFEQLAEDLGITELKFMPAENNKVDICIKSDTLGTITLIENNLIGFECKFDVLAKNASLKKMYTPLPKYPPVIEDMAFIADGETTVGELIKTIKQQSTLIKDVQLFDKYQDTRTFRVIYQHPEKNLASEDVTPVREKIIKTLKEKGIRLK